MGKLAPAKHFINALRLWSTSPTAQPPDLYRQTLTKLVPDCVFGKPALGTPAQPRTSTLIRYHYQLCKTALLFLIHIFSCDQRPMQDTLGNSILSFENCVIWLCSQTACLTETFSLRDIALIVERIRQLFL